VSHDFLNHFVTSVPTTVINRPHWSSQSLSRPFKTTNK
jgi:hypothetical protein